MNHFSSTVSTIVRQKRRSEGYLLVLLVHGFLVLRESRRSLSVEPVQVVTLCAKVTCTGINGVEIMTRVPRRHGDRHGESKDTSTKISNNTSLLCVSSNFLLFSRGCGLYLRAPGFDKTISFAVRYPSSFISLETKFTTVQVFLPYQL